MSSRPLTALSGDDKVQSGAAEDSGSAVAAAWGPLSLDTLARLQCVGPVSDLSEISALWPEDDDPDQLLQHILTERSARRKVANSEGET